MATLINAYCTVRQTPDLEFPHVLNASRDRKDPELAQHLDGFSGYVFEQGGGEMTQSLFHVLLHIRRVQHHLSISVEETDLDAFAEWAGEANAVCFMPDGSVRSPTGAALVLPAGKEPDPNAEVPYPSDARERKVRTEKQLEKLGVRTPSSLPPVIGAPELQLRSASEVARRARALFVVALRAESFAGETEIPVSELKTRFVDAFSALSPLEQDFIDESDPQQQAVINAVWRYESLALLLWSLGRLSDLPLAKGVCDVSTLAKLMLEAGAALADEAELRPAGEILDALDLHYRLHWAVRQASVEHESPPADLEPGVIVERHHALNWLSRFQDADWDDVDTPT